MQQITGSPVLSGGTSGPVPGPVQGVPPVLSCLPDRTRYPRTGQGVPPLPPPPDQGVVATPWAVHLLRSRSRTVLFQSDNSDGRSHPTGPGHDHVPAVYRQTN